MKVAIYDFKLKVFSDNDFVGHPSMKAPPSEKPPPVPPPIDSSSSNIDEDIDKLNSRSLFKFMFVRHPFYRLASTFQFMFVRDGIPPKKNVELIRNYQKKHMKLDDKDLVFFPNVSFAIFTEFLLHQAQNKNRSFDSVSNLPPEAIHW